MTSSRDPVPTPTVARRAPRTFIRLHPGDDEKLLLQTAVTTYTCDRKTLHLHSLLHIADVKYYTYLQTYLNKLTAHYGFVLFELLTSAANIAQKPYPRVIRRSLATQSVRAAATALNAVAQADVLDPQRPRWQHADATVEEFSSKTTVPSSSLLLSLAVLLVSSWLPCPELYAAFFDTTAGCTQVPFRASLSLLSGDVITARRLVFASKITNVTSTSAQSATNRFRNTVAWGRVTEAFLESDEVALLYGAWHTPALCRCAEAEGWQFSDVRWETAMVIDAPSVRVKRVVLVILTLAAYVVYSAVDWVVLVDQLALTVEDVHPHLPFFKNAALYAGRHIGPYIVFRRWFRVWNA